MKNKAPLFAFLAAAVIGSILGVMPLTLAQMHQLGLVAYDAHRYIDSRHWFLVPAYLGDHQAQTLLGFMYSTGNGVGQDGKSATYWLERAASADETEAQTMLGTLYATGVAVPRDPEKAIFWLSKAASRGDQHAKQMLGAYRLHPGSM